VPTEIDDQRREALPKPPGDTVPPRNLTELNAVRPLSRTI
jgi:hypothetical protein